MGKLSEAADEPFLLFLAAEKRLPVDELLLRSGLNRRKGEIVTPIRSYWVNFRGKSKLSLK